MNLPIDPASPAKRNDHFNDWPGGREQGKQTVSKDPVVEAKHQIDFDETAHLVKTGREIVTETQPAITSPDGREVVPAQTYKYERTPRSFNQVHRNAPSESPRTPALMTATAKSASEVRNSFLTNRTKKDR